MLQVFTDDAGHKTVRQALSDFFESIGLSPDGGAQDDWVRLSFGRFYIPFPNFPARKNAVKYHDIHHIVAGYPGTWQGEAEIGAWEVSSGCGQYTAAWILDMGIFALGLFIFPRAVFRGFIRGRRSLNLFHGHWTYDTVLDMPIGEVQRMLKLDVAEASQPTVNETMAFILWWMIAYMASMVIFVLPVVIAIWCVIHL